MKLIKTITTFHRQSEDSWPPESVIEAMEWFATEIDKIPREFLASATIEIGNEGYEASPEIKIRYRRFETDEEERDRERAPQTLD